MNAKSNQLNPMYLRTQSWPAFAGLRELQREMNRLFDGGSIASIDRFPLVNLLSGSDGAVVTAEVPGVNAEEIEISLMKGVLTIKGTIKDDAPEGENVVCHRRERRNGEFVRSIALPFEVEEDKISAKYDKGVLAVTLPRAEKAKPRTIAVETN